MNANNEQVLALSSIELRRRRRPIVRDVNMRIERGQRWVLFGPNGIGKSTLVSMMSARLFPSAGTVEILGKRLGTVDVSSLRPHIGLASSDLADELPPMEDPLDVVLTGLTGTAGRWKELFERQERERALQLMEEFQIAYLAGKAMWQLSTGERTRVLIARALMNDPELLILDEPTTGLDLGGRERVMRTLGRLGTERSNRAVILVTHRLEEIPEGFDHIAMMGRMRTEDSQASAAEGFAPDAPDNPEPGTIVYSGPIEEGLNDARLSSMFDMPIQVVRTGKRWSAFAR
ncbi:ABC transporter ATP-binding protein [Bifidobacterium tsurumiense]|uniref:ABC-type molybdenum transport system protein n=2 Tax=Bifidobacterium tsurumiense TaxID=356829 RepID=A0A087EEA2_9BIFI|nr:ATP-binding cassette domain-containing protein [Bifidobacterium tsurumiense]KFJ06103.1 ABC-type molybdenum transport system protein [Bifidobacterium tsurumiense]